jgi:hypothetical protein
VSYITSADSSSPKAAIIRALWRIWTNGPMNDRYASAPSIRPAGASQTMSSAT